MASLVNSMKPLIEIISILYKFFLKINEKEHSFPKKFYEANINLIAKPDKHITRKRKTKP